MVQAFIRFARRLRFLRLAILSPCRSPVAALMGNPALHSKSLTLCSNKISEWRRERAGTLLE